MTRNEKEKLRQERESAELEKDTIHYLCFVPLDGNTKVDGFMSPNNPWVVRLFSNPEGRPEIIERAIRTFEERNNVESWKELAVRHELKSIWYP